MMYNCNIPLFFHQNNPPKASLQKNLQESQKILSQKSNLSTEIYHNIIKEQGKIENNQRNLAIIKKTYTDELENLKHILFADSATLPTEQQDQVSELKQLIDFNMHDAKNKIFSINELYIYLDFSKI